MRSFFLGIIVIAVAASCKKAVPKQAEYIPKEASSVIIVDVKSLREKTAGTGMNLDSAFTSFERRMPGEDDDSEILLGDHLKDLRNSGIDTTGDFFVFVKSGGSIINGQQQSVGIIALLKDRSKLETWLKKQFPDKVVKTTPAYSYMALGDNFVAGWNKEVVIVALVRSGNYSPGTYSTGEGTLSQQALTTSFSLKESETVASVDEFRNLVAEKADMHFWTNVSGGLGSFAFLGITKVGDLLRNMYVSSTVNFETGKAVMESKTYVGKELADILKKYPGAGIDPGMIERFPLQPEGFLSFSVDPRILVEILKYTGAQEFIQQLAPDLGFTVDDVSKAFSGDIAVMFGGLSIGEGINKTSARFIFNAKIGDKAAYDKIVTALADKGFMIKRDNEYVPGNLSNKDMKWRVDDKNLVIASDENLLNQYKTGTDNAQILAEIKDKIAGKSGALYVDLNKILQSLPADSAHTETKEMAKTGFKDIVATSDNFDGEMIKTHAELRMIDDKENSLAAIVRFLRSAKKNRPGFVKGFRLQDGNSLNKTEPLPPPPVSGQ